MELRKFSRTRHNSTSRSMKLWFRNRWIRFGVERSTAFKRYSGNEIYLKASPSNVFIGGPGSDSPGFPPKACGNDGLRLVLKQTQQAAGIDPQGLTRNETRNT